MSSETKSAVNARKPSSSSGVYRVYLLAFSHFVCAKWIMVAVVTIGYVLKQWGSLDLDGGVAFHQFIEIPLKGAQWLGCMEVLHAALGIVPSGVTTTILQNSSRVYMVWGLLEYSMTSRQIMPMIAMILAWSASEIIRSIYYILQQVGIEPYLATWLRYSGWIILYPIGITCELWIMCFAWHDMIALPNSLPMPNYFNITFNHKWIYYAVAVLYVTGIPVLLGHMAARRNKKLFAHVKKD